MYFTFHYKDLTVAGESIIMNSIQELYVCIQHQFCVWMQTRRSPVEI